MTIQKQRPVDLDSRMIRIIDALGGESEYITIADLATKMGTSRRQMEYDLTKLNNIFSTLEMPLIDTKQNTGIKLEHANFFWFGEVFRDGQKKVKFVYRKKERIALIIVHIIIGGASYRNEDFCKYLGVSRTTIFSDMKGVKTIIEDYGASLQYDYYYKYYIKATGIQYSRLLKKSARELFKNIPTKSI